MNMQNAKRMFLAAASCAVLAGCASTTTTSSQKAESESKKVVVNAVTAEGIGAAIGHIEFSDSPKGLVIKTELSQLPPGPHGFHIHEKPSCAPADKDGKPGAALAAGGHYNPHQVPNHGTPLTGHLGDLPLLLVETNGTATTTLNAPRLSLKDLAGRAVMVHAGGDNYSDHPKPLGGGGDRIACGVIQ